MSHGIDSPIGIIGRNTYFNLFDMFFFCNFCMGKSYGCLLFILFPLEWPLGAKRARRISCLPLKKASKMKKKPVVDVEEIRARSPEFSLSDLARMKLADLMTTGEVSETKRLKDLAILEAAVKDLEDGVMKETKSKETKSKGTKSKDSDERKKRSHSRSALDFQKKKKKRASTRIVTFFSCMHYFALDSPNLHQYFRFFSWCNW